MCNGHGQLVVVGKTISELRSSAGEIEEALQYSSQALEYDSWSFEPRPQPPKHFLYRIYGADSELLYIGESNNVERRMREHSKLRPWWPERRRIDIEPFASEQEAVDAERIAIRAEYPKYNIVHAIANQGASPWITYSSPRSGSRRTAS